VFNVTAKTVVTYNVYIMKKQQQRIFLIVFGLAIGHVCATLIGLKHQWNSPPTVLGLFNTTESFPPIYFIERASAFNLMSRLPVSSYCIRTQAGHGPLAGGSSTPPVSLVHTSFDCIKRSYSTARCLTTNRQSTNETSEFGPHAWPTQFGAVVNSSIQWCWRIWGIDKF